MNSLKTMFLLDPEVIFLNHGSFGATPRPVFQVYQQWQLRLERQPVHFIDKEMPALLENARCELGNYLNAAACDLVFIPNVTFGINVVARSLALGPDDEVLSSDHEYGACDRAWQFLSQKRGFTHIRQPIGLPLCSEEGLVERFMSGVTSRTKVIFISHITSSTAQHLPVEAICARAREAGLLTVVDGAHTPGQIPLDLADIGADFYVGNCHKWLCGPKGSAFLYARTERQSLIEPLVVGWGWGTERTLTFGSDYLDYLQWLGTNDPAAYLSVPAAIQFQAEHNWPAVRHRCHELLDGALARIRNLTGLSTLYPDDSSGYHQMAIAQLPPIDDLPAFKRRLYEAFNIEVPCIQWNDRQFIRISIQGYNSEADVDALLHGLELSLGYKR